MNLRTFKGMKGEDVLVNADNVTFAIPSPERETECLIYFSGENENCIRVKHDITTVKNKLL